MNSQSAQPVVGHRGTVEFNAALRVRATAPVSERDYPHQQELESWLGQQLLGRREKITITDVIILAKQFSRAFGIDAPWDTIAHPRCTAILADTCEYLTTKRRNLYHNVKADRAGNVAPARPAARPRQHQATRAGRPICSEHFIAIPLGTDHCDQCSDGDYHAPAFTPLHQTDYADA